MHDTLEWWERLRPCLDTRPRLSRWQAKVCTPPSSKQNESGTSDLSAYPESRASRLGRQAKGGNVGLNISGLGRGVYRPRVDENCRGQEEMIGKRRCARLIVGRDCIQ